MKHHFRGGVAMRRKTKYSYMNLINITQQTEKEEVCLQDETLGGNEIFKCLRLVIRNDDMTCKKEIKLQ